MSLDASVRRHENTCLLLVTGNMVTKSHEDILAAQEPLGYCMIA